MQSIALAAKPNIRLPAQTVGATATRISCTTVQRIMLPMRTPYVISHAFPHFGLRRFPPINSLEVYAAICNSF